MGAPHSHVGVLEFAGYILAVCASTRLKRGQLDHFEHTPRTRGSSPHHYSSKKTPYEW
ncbi:hypothetical protein CY34DRAFT_811805 [Suillus luteus UH-Slu-Lm8-n1]|uniref:Uncharacterized protein n=1 Tax=Suillus luteus UH-Slu-Lm8-n1 TaxID=930992 RepID=A0A0D0A2H3_9AGAM|nr:hypothetical protein CY34DRAFT_811805 [Suillus luteus UH-Slu-Lm8-n1]